MDKIIAKHNDTEKYQGTGLRMSNFYEGRKDYASSALRREDLCSDPFEQFKKWFSEAEKSVIEPSAMALATSSEGKPSCRMVLFRGVNEGGFLFFTNYDSRKGRELLANPHAALTFCWKELERQICIEGSIQKTSREISLAYFNKRPRKSRISALASPQSQVISSKKELEEEAERLEKIYDGIDIPLPEFWGGFRVIPTEIEFWQGRPSRLHDRYRYIKQDTQWNIVCLAP